MKFKYCWIPFKIRPFQDFTFMPFHIHHFAWKKPKGYTESITIQVPNSS